MRNRAYLVEVRQTNQVGTVIDVGVVVGDSHEFDVFRERGGEHGCTWGFRRQLLLGESKGSREVELFRGLAPVGVDVILLAKDKPVLATDGEASAHATAITLGTMFSHCARGCIRIAASTPVT